MSPHAQIREDKKIRCVLAHDHVLLRQGVRRLLEDDPDIAVAAETSNAAQTLRVVSDHRPDLVITTAHLFGRDPENCLNLIVRESPHSKVLLLGTEADGQIASQSRSRVSRHTSASELIDVIHNMCPPESVTRKETRRREVAEWPTEEFLPRQRTLTVRERQVLKLLAEGRTVRSVASILGLSVKTIDAHKFNLMRKLGIHNKAELVMWAIQKNVVKLPVNL